MGRQSSIQALKPFEMVVDTTIAGASGVGNFQLLLDAGSTYRFKVEWGDGVVSGISTDTSPTHTYPSGGTYTIKVYGRCDQIKFNNSSEADKISQINSFGNIVWKDFGNSFQGSANMVGNFSDSPVFEQMTDSSGGGLQNAFNGSTNFNNTGSTSMNTWDVSNVKNIGYCFRDCSNFNDTINDWDVGNVITFDYTFMGLLHSINH